MVERIDRYAVRRVESKMGLDMYLYRAKRFRDATMDDVEAVEDYISYRKYLNSNDKKEKGTFQQWCGRGEIPQNDFLNYYSGQMSTRYYAWDNNHKYPHESASEMIGYWRKANCIHDWFVENVQDGWDDCEFHNEVTEENLIDLLNKCRSAMNLMEQTDEKDEYFEPVYKVIEGKEDEIASILPTRQGFFFGDTGYDSGYYYDLEETIRIIEEALDTTDFDKEMIYYLSSW